VHVDRRIGVELVRGLGVEAGLGGGDGAHQK
jgi:hypothetical protein